MSKKVLDKITTDQTLIKRGSPSSEEENKYTIKRVALGDVTNKPTAYQVTKQQLVTQKQPSPKKPQQQATSTPPSSVSASSSSLTTTSSSSMDNNENNQENQPPLASKQVQADQVKHLSTGLSENMPDVININRHQHQQHQQKPHQITQSTLITQNTMITQRGIHHQCCHTVRSQQHPAATANIIVSSNHCSTSVSRPQQQQQQQQLHQQQLHQQQLLHQQRFQAQAHAHAQAQAQARAQAQAQAQAQALRHQQQQQQQQQQPSQANPLFYRPLDLNDFQRMVSHHLWGDEWNTVAHDNIDLEFVDDAAEYIPEIHHNCRINQLKYQPRDYMAMQTDITPHMRAQVIDWMVDVVFEHHLKNETIFLASNYLDRYLSLFLVKKDQFQMYGAACLYLACKYEEVQPPTSNDIIVSAGEYFTMDSLVEAEAKVLRALKFSLTAPTVKFFLGRYLRALGPNADARISLLAHFYGELSLLDYNLVTFLPSIVAAACVYLALLTTGNPWTSTLVYYTRVYVDNPFFIQCVRQLWIQHRYDHVELQCIKRKYGEHVQGIPPLDMFPVMGMA